MGLLDSVLKVFVGDKSKKDISEIQPIVDRIKEHESAMSQVSIDELRGKSDEFRKRIKEDQNQINDQIEALEKEADVMEDIDKKEEIYNQIDALKDDRYEIERKTLDDILNYLDNSVTKLAKDTLNNHEFQMNDNDLDQFLSSQYDIRLDNLLQGKDSNIHHLESGMKNKTIQRKQILLDKIKEELNSK